MNPEDAVRRTIDAYNRHDVDAFAAMLDPNFVIYDPRFPEPLKATALRKMLEGYFRAVPDDKLEILNISAKGDTVAAEVAESGTFKGPLETPRGTIPPTGRHFEFRWALFRRVNSKGLVEEARNYYDVVSTLRQFGVKPEQLGLKV